MRVLALYQRLLLCVVLAVAYAGVIAVVHGTEYVRLAVVSRLLVLHGTRRILGLDPVIGRLEVRPVSGLVTERPEYYAGVVEVPLHVAHVAFHMGLRIVLAPRERTLAVSHAVALDIRLGHHIEPVAVAELVPVAVVGIVACTDSVDVEALHQLHVLQHPLAADHISAVGIHLMPVHALEEHAPAVHENLRIPYLYLPEAHSDRNGLSSRRCQKPVHVWGFGRPLAGLLHLEAVVARRGYLPRKHFVTLGIEQGKRDICPAFPAQFYLEHAVLIASVKATDDPDVLDAPLLPGVEVAVSRYTGISEEVLVFEIGAVAPAEHLEADKVVLARAQVARDVELGLELAVLAVAYILPVDPEVHVGSDRTEVRDYVFSAPACRDLHDPAVASHMVALFGHERGIVPVLVAPGIAHVKVHRVAVSVELPYARHVHLVPVSVVVVLPEEVRRTFPGVLGPRELPFSVEGQIVRRGCRVGEHGGLGALVCEVRSMHGGPAVRVHPRVLPFGEGLRTGAQSCREHKHG